MPDVKETQEVEETQKKTPDLSAIRQVADSVRANPAEEVEDADEETQTEEPEKDDESAAPAEVEGDTSADDSSAVEEAEQEAEPKSASEAEARATPDSIKHIASRLGMADEARDRLWADSPNSFLIYKDGLDEISAKNSQRAEALAAQQAQVPEPAPERPAAQRKVEDDNFELGDADDDAADIESRINQRADKLANERLAPERESIAAERKFYQAESRNRWLAATDNVLSVHTGTVEAPDPDYAVLYGHGKSEAMTDSNDPQVKARLRLLKEAANISRLATLDGASIGEAEALEAAFDNINRAVIKRRLGEEIVSTTEARAKQVLQGTESKGRRMVKETPRQKKLSNIRKAADKART